MPQDELLKTLVKRSTGEKPPQPDFSNPQIQRLRELLNYPLVTLKGNVETVKTPAGPVRVPKAPGGMADPTINNPELARMHEFLMKIAPNLRGTVKDVRLGPNKDVDYLLTNLLGTTNIGTRNISINPSTFDAPSFTPLEVLTHELTHAAGYGGEKEPTEAASIIRKVYGPPKEQRRLSYPPQRK